MIETRSLVQIRSHAQKYFQKVQQAKQSGLSGLTGEGDIQLLMDGKRMATSGAVGCPVGGAGRGGEGEGGGGGGGEGKVKIKKKKGTKGSSTKRPNSSCGKGEVATAAGRKIKPKMPRSFPSSSSLNSAASSLTTSSYASSSITGTPSPCTTSSTSSSSTTSPHFASSLPFSSNPIPFIQGYEKAAAFYHRQLQDHHHYHHQQQQQQQQQHFSNLSLLPDVLSLSTAGCSISGEFSGSSSSSSIRSKSSEAERRGDGDEGVGLDIQSDSTDLSWFDPLSHPQQQLEPQQQYQQQYQQQHHQEQEQQQQYLQQVVGGKEEVGMVVEEGERELLEETLGLLSADELVEFNTGSISDDINGSQKTLAPTPHSIALNDGVGNHSQIRLPLLPPHQEWQQQQQLQYSLKPEQEEEGKNEHPHTPPFASVMLGQQPQQQHHEQRQQLQQLQFSSLSFLPSSSASACVPRPLQTSSLCDHQHGATQQQGLQLQQLQQLQQEGGEATPVFQTQQCVRFCYYNQQQEA